MPVIAAATPNSYSKSATAARYRVIAARCSAALRPTMRLWCPNTPGMNNINCFRPFSDAGAEATVYTYR